MAGTDIRTRDWTATHSVDDIAGSHPHVTVKGEVETSASNQRAKLEEARPQGVNPRILLLTLKIETEGDVGNTVMGWVSATYTKAAERGDITHVEILHEGNPVATIEIQNVVS